MKKSTTLMIIIGFALFGLMFGLSFCDNDAAADETPEVYEVTVTDFPKPEMRGFAAVPPADQQRADELICTYTVFVDGLASLTANVEIDPKSESVPDNYDGSAPFPFRIGEKVTIDSVPLLSESALQQFAIDHLSYGGSPGPEWTFDRWLPHPITKKEEPEIYFIDRKCTKDLAKEQTTKVSR